jgi:hypothetical protein
MMNSYRELLRSLSRIFYRLSRRERWIVGGGALLLAVLLGYVFVFSPMLSQARLYDRLIPRKEKEIADLSALIDQYKSLSAQLSEVEARIRPPGDFSILSYVEETAVRGQIRGNIAYIRPLAVQTREGLREVPVEVKVENVTLPSLVGFISSFDQAPALLKVRRISLRTRFADPQFMDATFVVSSFEKG